MRNLVLTSLIILASAQTANAAGVSEKILGYQPSRNGVSFQVKSGGCTSREDFMAEIKRSPSEVTEVTLIRVRPDNCHPFIPMGIRFRISYDDLGLAHGEQFKIVNQNGTVNGMVWE
ncbi:MAG: hypothetical protein ACXVA9_07615 [Bdellovibrionales bacterium]